MGGGLTGNELRADKKALGSVVGRLACHLARKQNTKTQNEKIFARISRWNSSLPLRLVATTEHCSTGLRSRQTDLHSIKLISNSFSFYFSEQLNSESISTGYKIKYTGKSITLKCNNFNCRIIVQSIQLLTGNGAAGKTACVSLEVLDLMDLNDWGV